MRRVSWRMRNGVSSRWVAALAVATSSCGLSRLRLQRVQRRQPLRHHPQGGRSAVVGQAVPGREGQHLDLGREQRHGFGERAHRRFVGGDHDRAAALPDAVRRAREVGGEPRQEARRHAGQGQRLVGAKDALQRLAHCAIRM